MSLSLSLSRALSTVSSYFRGAVLVRHEDRVVLGKLALDSLDGPFNATSADPGERPCCTECYGNIRAKADADVVDDAIQELCSLPVHVEVGLPDRQPCAGGPELDVEGCKRPAVLKHREGAPGLQSRKAG